MPSPEIISQEPSVKTIKMCQNGWGLTAEMYPLKRDHFTLSGK